MLSLRGKQEVMQMMRMVAHPMLTQNLLPLNIQKLALAQNNELHRAMSAATTALESVISSKKNQKPQGEDVDDAFGKLLVGQLKLIPESDLKDDLKISLRQRSTRPISINCTHASSIVTKLICYATKFNAFICILAVSTFKFEFPTKL